MQQQQLHPLLLLLLLLLPILPLKRLENRDIATPCKSDWNLTHDDSALNDFCCFRLLMIHIAVTRAWLKLESFF